MDKEHLKKILAGVGIAGLIGGAIVVTPERALSAWGGGKAGAGSTTEEKKAEPKKTEQQMTDEEKAKAEQAKEGETKTETEKPAGKSSWSGTKK